MGFRAFNPRQTTGSTSKNAVSISSACTTNRFPSMREAPAIKFVRLQQPFYFSALGSGLFSAVALGSVFLVHNNLTEK